MPPYLSASETAELLGISLPTLYAYVSRGMIRSEPTGDDHRTRRYLREDVERLKTRKEQRENPAKAAETALNWGEPVLESAITLIENGRLYYRGQDAVELAQTRTLEEVAGLIWQGTLSAEIFTNLRVARKPSAGVEGQLPDDRIVEKFQTVLSLAGSEDLLAFDLSPAGVAKTGARIVRLLAGLLAPNADENQGVAQMLAEGWGLTAPQAVDLLNLALILCADHELNVSSFTARCVASAGGTPYGVVIAGLAALQGYKHGGATGQVEAFLREAGSAGGSRGVIVARIRRGEGIPGFGHKLYPDGDPRGAVLVARVTQDFPDSPAVILGNAVIAEMAALNGLRPTVDFGLVMLAGALGLPLGSGLTLFALGRTVGWIGQALEQYDLDTLIRPRARYTGVIPRK
ncbi:MAG TPA: citrate synthase family protein [Anaerolineales bacterium]|nr:citrate synthase family protein [Anaerolineales bacterium]